MDGLQIFGVYIVHVHHDLMGNKLDTPLVFKGICMEKKPNYTLFMEYGTQEVKIIEGNALFTPIHSGEDMRVTLEGLPKGPSLGPTKTEKRETVLPAKGPAKGPAEGPTEGQASTFKWPSFLGTAKPESKPESKPNPNPPK